MVADPYTQCATLSCAPASARPTGGHHWRLTASGTDNRRPRSRIKRAAYASVQFGSRGLAVPDIGLSLGPQAQCLKVLAAGLFFEGIGADLQIATPDDEVRKRALSQDQAN